MDPRAAWFIAGVAAAIVASMAMRLASRRRRFLGGVRGDVDPWVVEYVAERAYHDLLPLLTTASERVAALDALRRSVVVGTREAFNAAAPWRPGITTLAVAGHSVWAIGDRAGLEERIATAAAHVVWVALHGPGKADAEWLRRVTARWEAARS